MIWYFLSLKKAPKSHFEPIYFALSVRFTYHPVEVGQHQKNKNWWFRHKCASFMNTYDTKYQQKSIPICSPKQNYLFIFAMTQWSKWPKFVSLHYWRAPRGARGVKKSGQPKWSPLWWAGALRFSQNWRNCEKQSKLNKNCQRNPVFWRFFKF